MKTVVVALGGNAFFSSFIQGKDNLSARFKFNKNYFYSGYKGVGQMGYLSTDAEIVEVIRKHRIGISENVLGCGDKNKGFKKIKEFLQKSYDVGFNSGTLGKYLKKDRHTLHEWIKRYNLQVKKYGVFKPAIIQITFNEDEASANVWMDKVINNKGYRVFFIQPTNLFSYIVGLVLGDGHVGERKVNITGGGSGSYAFLDRVHAKFKDFGNYFGDRTVVIKHFSKDDKIVKREDSLASYWRIYVYWSAFANLFNDKGALQKVLSDLWKTPDLFNSFTAGLFDTDGYFVFRGDKPERIGIDQVISKSWFMPYFNELQKHYSVVMTQRKREYRIQNRGKIYTGTSHSYIIRIKMRSWPNFVDNIVLPFCNKPNHLERAHPFKNHSLKMHNRWRP